MNNLPKTEENQLKRNANAATHSPDTSPKKSHRKLIFIGAILLAVLFFFVRTFGSLYITGIVEEDNWLEVTEAFMFTMTNKNPNKAYSMFSTQARKEISVSELEEFMKDPFFAIFDGYLEMELSDWEITSTFEEDRFVELNAIVTYEGGYTGSFNGVLEEEGDEWNLLSFNVTISPEKLEDYEKNNP